MDDEDLRHVLAREIAAEDRIMKGPGTTLQIAWILLQAILLVRHCCRRKPQRVPAKILKRLRRQLDFDRYQLIVLCKKSGYEGDPYWLATKIFERAGRLTEDQVEELWHLA